MDERIEKLQALLEAEGPDQIFVDSLEETQANLQARGIEFSTEELKELAKNLTMNAAEGELSEDALEDVAGGVSVLVPAIIKWVASVCGPKLLPKIRKW